ncbi:MAG: hypothetical protein HKN08_08395, partial [Gammaproteobacteria bacterium]|nr:hypothetical protein [Gammaproteobacteria bacterium]
MVNTGLNEAKMTLRTALKRHLQTIEPGQKAAMDQSILLGLQGLQQIQTANHVFCYVSTGHEVATHKLIDWLIHEDKQVSVPTICHE